MKTKYRIKVVVANDDNYTRYIPQYRHWLRGWECFHGSCFPIKYTDMEAAEGFIESFVGQRVFKTWYKYINVEK